jgi:hypothetical protein
MEEKKNLEHQGTSTPSEKLSYEQLENIAHQLSEQSRRLYAKLQEVQIENTFKRLNYLFEIVKLKESFDSTFVQKCIDEIVLLMSTNEEPTAEVVE